VACVGGEVGHAMKLEAGEFEHPGCGKIVGLKPGLQHVEHGRRNIARHRHAPARALQHQPGQTGDGGLAVGAGDGDDLGRIASLFAQRVERPLEQMQLTGHRHAPFGGCLFECGKLGRVRCNAGAAQHQLRVAQ